MAFRRPHGIGIAGRLILLLRSVLFLCIIGKSIEMSVEEAILTDMLDEGSTSCVDTGETSWNTTYSSSIATSNWSSYITEAIESSNFQAMMEHNGNGEDKSKNWKIRIGKGGNIYSHVNEVLGELIPPQERDDQDAWIDETTMMVSVDIALNFAVPNKMSGGKNFQHYVHQAGAYNRDVGLPPIFYSPNIAMHCADHSCAFASWGQHAHVPTIFESDILYFTRFRNCGDGVMEITQGHYNTAYKVNDRIKLTNTPWGAFRASKLGSSQRTNPDGSFQEAIPEIPKWGTDAERESITNTDQSGGFHVLSETIPTDAEIFMCIKLVNGVYLQRDPCTQDDIDNDGWERFDMIARNIGRSSRRCAYRPSGVLKCGTTDLKPGKNQGASYGPISIKNNRTNEIVFSATGVRHWFYGGTYSSFFTGATEDETTINNNILEGDALIVVRQKHGSGRTEENKMALTFVHGKYPAENGVSHRLRVGVAADTDRDFIILTINARGAGLNVGKHEMYWNREFYAFGRHADAKDVGNTWVDSTAWGWKKYPSEWNGRKIGLYTSASGSTFRAYASERKGDTLPETCDDQALQCEGMSTPTAGYEAFFTIECGKQFYVGPDQHHFTPSYTQYDMSEPVTETNFVRPYNVSCGKSPGERAQFRFLGFFNETSCLSLANKEYDSFPCPIESLSMSPSESSSMPSLIPTSIPLSAPSSMPSQGPSSLPSSETSFTPSSDQSSMPSTDQSSVPSTEFSSLPSSSSDRPSEFPSTFLGGSSGGSKDDPSRLPSESPTTVPFVSLRDDAINPSNGYRSDSLTSIPLAKPSEYPSKEPSQSPTPNPSVISSEYPSDSPSKFSSNAPTNKQQILFYNYLVTVQTSSTVNSSKSFTPLIWACTSAALLVTNLIF